MAIREASRSRQAPPRAAPKAPTAPGSRAEFARPRLLIAPPAKPVRTARRAALPRAPPLRRPAEITLSRGPGQPPIILRAPAPPAFEPPPLRFPAEIALSRGPGLPPIILPGAPEPQRFFRFFPEPEFAGAPATRESRPPPAPIVEELVPVGKPARAPSEEFLRLEEELRGRPVEVSPALRRKLEESVSWRELSSAISIRPPGLVELEEEMERVALLPVTELTVAQKAERVGRLIREAQVVASVNPSVGRTAKEYGKIWLATTDPGRRPRHLTPPERDRAAVQYKYLQATGVAPGLPMLPTEVEPESTERLLGLGRALPLRGRSGRFVRAR